MSRVGETGVGEMEIGETGVGEMGVGETGPNLDGYIMKTCPCNIEIFFKKQKVQVSLIFFIYIFS